MQHAALPLAGVAAAAAAFLYRRELKELISPLATLPTAALKANGITPGPGGRNASSIRAHAGQCVSTT